MRVAVIRCDGYEQGRVDESIARIFELLGGVDKFVKRGQRVLLKPNFIAPKESHLAVQTDGAVLIAISKLLLEHGVCPVIGDSPAWGDVRACAAALGIDEKLKQLGVGLKQLDRPKWVYLPEARMRVGISTAALEADAIINVPKLKSHQQLVATIAVKNMFGCVSGKWKPFWHYARGSSEERFCEMLVGIYKYLKPAITIVDGVVAMEGAGPIHGKPRALGMLVASEDAMGCEAVCAKAIGLDECELPIVRAWFAEQKPKIDFELVGDELAVCEDFERAKPIPIRFSLGRVCKSAAKQLLLRAGLRGK